jgi:hypothetical protein
LKDILNIDYFMTPKEKATEIMKSYMCICNSWNEKYVREQSIEYLKKISFNTQWWIPKEAALKACYIMITYCSEVEPYRGLDFWLEVKNEIKNF